MEGKHLMPRNTKPRKVIFYKFTLIDLGLMAVFMGVIIGVIASNLILKAKVGLSIVFALLGIILFLPKDDELIYYDILRIIMYLFENKTYSSEESVKNRKIKPIDLIIPYTAIECDYEEIAE